MTALPGKSSSAPRAAPGGPLRRDPALPAREVAVLAGGRLQPPDRGEVLVFGPVVVDSRAASTGALFVAIKGEHVDGHDYVAAAARAGACLAISDRPSAALPTVVVSDPVRALGQLAHGWLSRMPGTRVIGVTGSAGKTTTKDLLARVLARLGPTVAPPGSHNTEIGVPLTVLSAGAGTSFLVLEMGARGIGHIAELTRIAPPHLAVVLNVGAAHVGEFGSVERIAQGKGELVRALPADGVAVLNGDDPAVAAMSARTTARVITFGVGNGCDVRAADVRLAQGRPGFTLHTGASSEPVQLALVGAHQVHNALAAAAVALQVGLPLPVVAAELSSATPASRWRMEVHDRADGVTVVNDAYNANPESTRAALNALVAIASGRRTWAVIGQMLELGDSSEAEHQAVGRLAAQLGVDVLVGVGVAADPLARGATLAGGDIELLAADGVDGTTSLLADRLRPGDVVLVKASRGIGVERVAAALLGEASG